MKIVSIDGTVSADGDFVCASCGGIEATEVGFSIQLKKEVFPDWFQEVLNRLFEGRGVPKEYAFCFRLTNHSDRPAVGKARVQFAEHNGRNYLAPPYWIRGDYGWRRATSSEAAAEQDRSGASFELSLQPGQSVLVGSAPFVSPEEVVQRCRDIESTYELWSYREIGPTADGRGIPVLESPPRPIRVVVDATMQSAEPVAWSVLSVAHWLTVPTAAPRGLTDKVQFCLLPMTNPDGAAAGLSVTNPHGQVPKFALGRHVEGVESAAEAAAWWGFISELEPQVLIEMHSHNRWDRFWRAVGMTTNEVYSEGIQDRARALRDALGTTFSEDIEENEIRILDPRTEIHSVYGDQYLFPKDIIRVFLQAVSTSIEGQCADLQELVRTVATSLVESSSEGA